MDQRSGGPAVIPVGDVLRMVAATLQEERGRLNGLASFGGNGTHGDRIARAFTDAADAAQQSGTGDAGEDLELAAQVLSDPAYGRAARYYGVGLMQAAPQFLGRPGLSLADLAPLLAGILDGARQNNAAQPGEGTLIDVLEPAAGAVAAAVQQGLTYLQAIQGALGAASSGVRRTATMPQPYTRPPTGRPAPAPGYPDPGAASAQTILTGLVRGLLGDRVPATPSGQSSNTFLPAFLQQGIDLGGIVAAPPAIRMVESMLGNTARAGRSGQPPADASPATARAPGSKSRQ